MVSIVIVLVGMLAHGVEMIISESIVTVMVDMLDLPSVMDLDGRSRIAAAVMLEAAQVTVTDTHL
jgi:hypothetical protein